MENLTELISLGQQISAVIDDAGYGIISMHVDTQGDVSYLTSPSYIIEKFNTYEVIKENDLAYPAKLKTTIQGVLFRALIYKDEIELLKGRVPKNFYQSLINQDGNKIESMIVESAHKNSSLALACGSEQTEQTFFPNYA